MGMPLPKNDNKLTIKELKSFMDHHGIGKYELAEIFGITIQGVNFWLSGQRGISVTNSRLIRLFDKKPRLIKEF